LGCGWAVSAPAIDQECGPEEKESGEAVDDSIQMERGIDIWFMGVLLRLDHSDFLARAAFVKKSSKMASRFSPYAIWMRRRPVRSPK